jgi:glc operon protein GlcG
MKVTHTLTREDAMKAVAAVEAELDKNGEGGAIAVVDEHGELIAFVRRDGCPYTSIYIAINKAYTAARERKPSADVGKASREKGFPMTNFGELRFVSWGGGIPIKHEGVVIGAVGVSGLPEERDIEVATLGALAVSAG